VSESRIGITPKKLTIGLRPGTNGEAKRYFLSSPFDSDTHLSLIREKEKLVIDGKPGLKE
jgi:hypothetical protein